MTDSDWRMFSIVAGLSDAQMKLLVFEYKLCGELGDDGWWMCECKQGHALGYVNPRGY